MIKTFTQTPGPSRGLGLRKGIAGLLMASCVMAISNGAHADVFGSSPVANNAQSAALLERLSVLERELKELKEKNAQNNAAPANAKAPGPGKASLKLPPPPSLPGMEGLPGGGADERERLLVEKELTHEVVGTVNDMLIVRDGDKRFVLTKAEFKAFEKKKREQVIHKLKVEAVAESGARLNFPDLTPPPPPIPPEGSELSQAGQAVDQARAIEANGGKPPAPPPAPTGKSTSTTPAKKN